MRFFVFCKLCLTLKIALSENTHRGDKMDACTRQSACHDGLAVALTLIKATAQDFEGTSRVLC